MKLTIPGIGTVEKDFKLSDHFRLSEFFVTSHDKDLLWQEFCELPEVVRGVYFFKMKELAKMLDRVRYYYGKPVIINSGWRSKRVNEAVGGASASYHLCGMAADITVEGVPAKTVQSDWRGRWAGGMGHGKTFTHLDTRPYRARFRY